ncbi:UNVERIFIED_CONTAM: putative AC transposase [Sesamum latifolium]|uniref:AC transposase n=1 Tax=Sesamum latifolium TaxID=2727402 RepID=A0AAW2TAJ3_9LAMI
MARDVLAVPVSTIALEATFSTSSHILDAFRSCLLPKRVQALICTQDWLRKDFKPISIDEDLSELEVVEKELTKLGLIQQLLIFDGATSS